MKTNFKKYDKVVSISHEGELDFYKVYTIKEVFYFNIDTHHKTNHANLCIEGLIWSYHSKNFISLSEYRNLKLCKIEKYYENR